MTYEFKDGDIKGIVLIKSKKSSDERGLFIKGYEKSPFSKFLPECFEEDYVSTSNRNVLRGLHYQLDPMSQGKLITVLSGKILDATLDVREDSKNFGQSSLNELTPSKFDTIWVPPGFAHGFLSLENDTTVLNRCTREFSSELERGILWNDPFFKINWPLQKPILSEKDKNWKTWK
jgi:dTDP-4-dehydrorhamnose 3,5-epimerase